MTTGANIIVIGAGIIGASVAYHLTDMGIDNVAVVDKGDIDVTDGSTSHAPGGLRTLTASHFFTTLGVARRAVYDTLPLAVPGEEQFWRHGSVQVANTSTRFDSHKRLAAIGRSEGVELNLLTPAEIAELVPLIDPSTVRGGIHIPSSGVVPPAERTVAPDFAGPGYAIALHGDMVVHRAGPLYSLDERISMVNGYIALDTSVDEQSRSADLMKVDDHGVLFTEWAKMAAWRSSGRLAALIDDLPFTDDRGLVIARLEHAIADAQRAIEDMRAGERDMIHYGG